MRTRTSFNVGDTVITHDRGVGIVILKQVGDLYLVGFNPYDHADSKGELLHDYHDSHYYMLDDLGMVHQTVSDHELSEDNRSGAFTIFNALYDLYIDDGIFYVTEHNNPKNILMVTTREFWNRTFE